MRKTLTPAPRYKTTAEMSNRTIELVANGRIMLAIGPSHGSASVASTSGPDTSHMRIASLLPFARQACQMIRLEGGEPEARQGLDPPVRSPGHIGRSDEVTW